MALTLTENASGQAVGVEVKDLILFVPSPQKLAFFSPSASHFASPTASG